MFINSATYTEWRSETSLIQLSEAVKVLSVSFYVIGRWLSRRDWLHSGLYFQESADGGHPISSYNCDVLVEIFLACRKMEWSRWLLTEWSVLGFTSFQDMISNFDWSRQRFWSRYQTLSCHTVVLNSSTIFQSLNPSLVSIILTYVVPRKRFVKSRP